jgi:16S rRNA (guanine527-N7)-methyltransferase
LNPVTTPAAPRNTAISLRPSLHAALAAGLGQMQAALSETQQNQLLDYVALLDKWNKTYNLTAVREPERMVPLHILDSLAVLPHLAAAKSLIDVGTGAGLPGIPLAVARPDIAVTLLDTIAKKTTFVRQAIGELGLRNAVAANGRVENFQSSGFEIVISRAFAELRDFVEGAGHLVAPGGRLLAMKGVYPHDEIARLPDGPDGPNGPNAFTVSAVIPLTVPAVEGQRHLVVIQKN